MKESNTEDGDGGLSGDGSGSGDDEYAYNDHQPDQRVISKGMHGFVHMRPQLM